MAFGKPPTVPLGRRYALPRSLAWCQQRPGWEGDGVEGMGRMEIGMIQPIKSQGRRSSAFGFEMGLSQNYEIYSQDLAMNKR